MDKQLEVISILAKAKIALGRLTTDDIINVYNGKQGCACGCRGTYSDTQRSKKRIISTLRKKLDEVERYISNYGVDSDIQSEVGTAWFMNDGNREHIISWEGSERANRIYTKPIFSDIN